MQKIMRTVSQFFMACTISFGSASLVQAADEETYAQAMQAWAQVLAEHVDEQGRVDFQAIAQQPEHLKQMVDAIAQFSPSTTPEVFPTREHQLAYYINSYNALAMYGVIERDIPDGFTSFFKRASFFKFRDVMVGGKETNLYDYENKVIRPLDEPRVHFALNCMVKDCPRLPQVPFEAESLDAQLQAATIEFFNKAKHIRVDEQKRQVHLSSILDFYTKDFVASGKKQDLIPYVNRYAKSPIPADYKVKYIPYDWRINAQP